MTNTKSMPIALIKAVCLMLALLTMQSCFGLPSSYSAQPGNAAKLMDVHGAGAQRSDPKTGDPAEYAGGHGPQGDVVRIYNAARAVRSLAEGPDGYPVVDTNQVLFYDNTTETGQPAAGADFFGQDAHYSGNTPGYIDNGDSTVTDIVTGLTWQQDPGAKISWSQAAQKVVQANAVKLAGYTDWRLPTIKELYSLIDFSGLDVSPEANQSSNDTIPFIDPDYFTFSYGDTSTGDRIIDSQFISATEYVSTTMGGNRTAFGVNFADGRIKGYPIGTTVGGAKTFYVLLVRGNSDYGKNNFVDNGDGTVSDLATGLMWLQDDVLNVNWQQALAWAENLEYAGYADWRLPNAKELQSIVDYSRSPATSDSPAIDPVFSCSEISDEGGRHNYAFYWTGTTHASSAARVSGKAAVYVSFGEALGFFSAPGGSGPQAGLAPPQGLPAALP